MKNSTAGLLRVQAVYIFIISIWALFDIGSFMQVTGHKTDLWLMRMLSLIMISLAVSFVHAANTPHISSSILLLAFTITLVWLAIDVYYYSRGIIPRIYLADGFAQLVFAICWIRLFAMIVWKKIIGKLKEKAMTEQVSALQKEKKHSHAKP